MIIDLRSDTFTRPTPGMMEAIMKADVGDDVFGEDPSVNELEAKAAKLFGMEAALYCPTGTMSNQIAIKCHTRPGDELICEQTAHVYFYEAGGISANSHVQTRTLAGNFGRINAAQVEEVINPDDVHRPRTSLVCLENTSNRGGGTCYNFSDIKDIRKVCDDHN
ncbi:MAG TPA: aminotransferase class I/II-fold pyridoxal phosphate-dependent enzyme, partial [Chitinophagaceae bacterium]|nr:aminotransferase class I/II-fold pyridoxal phosphate-dependent enzyme [Chitinophagaceae bacterium]